MRRGGRILTMCLALVAASCGDDASDDETGAGDDPAPSTTEAPGDDEPDDEPEPVQGSTPLGDVTTEVLSFELFLDLPQPSGDTPTADRPPLTAWDGSAVLIGPAGGLVRLDPEEGAEVTPTEGIDTGDGDRVRAVDLLASADDMLLAIGHEQDLTADIEPSTRPFVWRSADGDTWEALDVTGLESGTDTVEVTAVTGDPDGGFLAGGEVDDGNQTTLTLWSSPDGEDWEVVDTPGLDRTDTEETGEHLVDLAVRGDTFLVVRETTGLDDSTLSMVRGTRDGDWLDLDLRGLDALDLPNSDVLPAVDAQGSTFVLFASVPVDPGEEFGERRPAIFGSGDGESWTAFELEGPTLEDPFFVQAITATDEGAVAVAEGVDALNVWRFSGT